MASIRRRWRKGLRRFANQVACRARATHSAGEGMRRFEMVQSTTETTTSHAGLALVGRALAMTGLDRELRQIPLRHGIAHADCVKSYVGLLCTGKSDFDAIENKRNDTFFITALGIERVASPPGLRSGRRARPAARQLRPPAPCCGRPAPARSPPARFRRAPLPP